MKTLRYTDASAAAVTAKQPVHSHAVSSEDKIRLRKFMTSFAVGGTEKQVAGLTRRIDKERFNLSFACLSRFGELIQEIENGGFTIDEYPISRLYGYRTFGRQLGLARALARDRIHIMHSYNFYANTFGIPAAKLARVPCIVASVRDLGLDLRPAQRRVQKWACSLADVVIVNAEAIRHWLIAQGLPARKVRVIRNGVDIAKFETSGGGNALRRELAIPQEAPVIVMLARLAPNKGAEQFLQAAPRIAQLYPDAHFVVAGGMSFRDKGNNDRAAARMKGLIRQSAELGVADRIHFLGIRSDVPEILAAATVSVLPSLSEGISNTLLESMAASVAVVATNVGGTPELIRDGRDGLLVPPDDVPAIADAVCSILGDPLLALRLGAQGRERAVASFSFDAMTRSTEEVYFELMESKRRAKRSRRRPA